MNEISAEKVVHTPSPTTADNGKVRMGLISPSFLPVRDRPANLDDSGRLRMGTMSPTFPLNRSRQAPAADAEGHCVVMPASGWFASCWPAFFQRPVMALADISNLPGNRPFHPGIFGKPQNSEQVKRGNGPHDRVRGCLIDGALFVVHAS